MTRQKAVSKCLLAILSVGLLSGDATGPQWETLRGVWTADKGQSAGSEGGLMVSRDWYGDLDFAGRIDARGDSLAAIVIRYAGETEGYAIVMDWRTARVFLREDHFGRSREAAGMTWKGGAGKPVRFRVTARGNNLSAELWPEDRKSDGVTLSFADLKVPEGRLGLGVRNGSVSYSDLQLSGVTTSRFETYAFHCNYRIPDRLAGEPLWQYLDAASSPLLRREKRNFKSVPEFEHYKREAIAGLRQSLGLDPWPERTPLNARIVGTVDRPDFKIEKVIFESQPGFLVNALLYIPKKARFPAPAILSTIGHYEDDGFFIWSEQGRCVGLVRKGYVVLTYDPIGQGERRWLGDGNHDRVRRKIILSGMEVSGLMFWDSIRAIDYLASRTEVDPERIGMTGVSGGGFNSLYTAVLDERVKAVAPAGYATSTEALIKRGRAGCCSYLPNLTRYAELQDVYSLIAPRKLLILGGYMDILSDRLLSTFEISRQVYRLYGAEESVRYFLDRDAGHTYSKPMRLEMYRGFNEWLKGGRDTVRVEEPSDPEDQLISRDSGLLKVFSPGERGVDVIDVERRHLARNQIKYDLPSSPQAVAAFQEQLRERLLSLMGAMAPPDAPRVVSDDHSSNPGSIRRVVLKTERDLPVAVAIHYPPAAAAARGTVVFFSMEERYPVSHLPAGRSVNRLAAEGFTVVAPEVRGSGRTRVADMNSIALFSMTLGKHLFSTRIFDLQRVLDFLQAQPEFQSQSWIVWGEGPREGLMALYLAAIDPRVKSVVASHGLVSYQNVVDNDGSPDFDYYVPGVLRYADMPEIIAAIAPRKVVISEPVDINNGLVGPEASEQAYAWAKKVYQVSGHPERLSVVSQLDLLAEVQKNQ